MSDFSQPPQTVLDQNRAAGFIGMHVMQGVPILDRDLNLLQDLVAATVRGLFSRYIGNGVPLNSQAFLVKDSGADNDFQICADAAAQCLVEGIEVNIAIDVAYSAQKAFGPVPALTTPGAARVDVVYLDVFLETVDNDPLLENVADIGLQTSVRLRPAWVVRVAEGIPVPDPQPGHAHYPLAKLSRAAGQAKINQAMIGDQRARCLSLDRVLQLLIQPVITGLSTNQAAVNTSVLILGRNLDVLGKPKVFFDTVEVAQENVTAFTSSSVTVKVPAAATGKVHVSIANDAGVAVSDSQLTIVGGGGG